MTTNETETLGMTVTITIPARLRDLLNQAAERIDITTGATPEQEALIIALLERGAASVTAFPLGEDHRKVSEVTVMQLCDAIGIVDLDQARKNAKDQREAGEKSLAHTLELFKDTQGLATVYAPLHRCANVECVKSMLGIIERGLAEKHFTHVLMAIGAVVKTEDGVESYRRVNVVTDAN